MKIITALKIIYNFLFGLFLPQLRIKEYYRCPNCKIKLTEYYCPSCDR